MALKLINGVLILFTLYMGIKQGWAMLTGKPEMLSMFGKWNFGQTGVAVLGGVTILGAVLVLIPQTFVWGNLITATTILIIIGFHAHDQNLKGVAIELPFFLLSLVIIYLQYPLGHHALRP